MEGVTLFFWLVTAAGGSYMAAILLRQGRRTSSATASRISSDVVFAHGTVAVLGAALWIGYIGWDRRALAWAALATLAVVVGLGAQMYLRWHQGRTGPDEQVHANEVRLAEQQIPSLVVHAHGFLAAVTILLALLVTLGVTG